MKYSIVPVLLFLLVSCSTPSKLSIALKPALSTTSYFTKDSIINLVQVVSFNKKNMIDEEHFETVTLTILDTTEVKNRKKINLEIDTNLIKVNYQYFSVWNWSETKTKIYGTIKVLDWNADKIKIRQNIKVKDFRRERTRKYKGIKKFVFKKTTEL